MSAKILVLFTVICTIAVSGKANPLMNYQPDCPKVCADMYDPTCGTDGTNFREFVNECELKAHNCRLVGVFIKPFEVTTLNWCRTEEVDTLDNLLQKLGNLELNNTKCLTPCHPIYKPVCISDGKYRLLADECVMVSINCAVGLEGDQFKVIRNDSC